MKRSVPNPVYEQLKVKLVDAETTVSFAAAAERRCQRAICRRLEKVQREQPGLLAEYQNMDRDYGVLRKNYEELLGRLQSANLAQAADTQADKVKLQIVDPPEVPRLPAAPNRLLLVSGVLVAGTWWRDRHYHSALDSSIARSRRLTICAAWGFRCLAEFRSWVGRRSCSVS